MYVVSYVDVCYKYLNSYEFFYLHLLSSLQSQKQYLEKSMKDAENNLRELITSKQKRWPDVCIWNCFNYNIQFK